MDRWIDGWIIDGWMDVHTLAERLVKISNTMDAIFAVVR